MCNILLMYNKGFGYPLCQVPEYPGLLPEWHEWALGQFMLWDDSGQEPATPQTPTVWLQGWVAGDSLIMRPVTQSCLCNEIPIQILDTEAPVSLPGEHCCPSVGGECDVSQRHRTHTGASCFRLPRPAPWGSLFFADSNLYLFFF